MYHDELAHNNSNPNNDNTAQFVSINHYTRITTFYRNFVQFAVLDDKSQKPYH